MLRKMLIPLDGSGLAERALEDAAALSASTAATLILLRTVELHTVPGMDDRAAEVEALSDAERYLREHAERLQHRGFTCEVVATYGPAAEWIVAEASLRDVDLIVMSTHGRSGPARWLLGSVAEAVLARTSVPVLLVRAWQPRGREMLLRDEPRVLVPLDGSAFAEAALPIAAGLADDVGAELVLIRVQPRPADVIKTEAGLVLSYVDQQEAGLVSEATDYLNMVAGGLLERWLGVPVSTRAELGDAASSITATAMQLNAALIVMTTHGRTGVSRAVLGSVAGRILEHSTASLVLVRPRDSDSSPEHEALRESSAT
jgi:nucleotide-binding universal stress UspA family protein